MTDVMVLFGSGGHSAEMLMLIRNANLAKKLETKLVNRLICVVSEDDELIREKLNHEFDRCKQKQMLEFVSLTRGRKVGQSYFTSIWTTLIGLLHSINLILTQKPKLCLTNGPAISVTVSLAIRCLQLITFGFCYKCDILYVESFCRTRKLSLSGKIIYHLRLATQFYVQWPQLLTLYPKAHCKGILV